MKSGPKEREDREGRAFISINVSDAFEFNSVREKSAVPLTTKIQGITVVRFTAMSKGGVVFAVVHLGTRTTLQKRFTGNNIIIIVADTVPGEGVQGVRVEKMRRRIPTARSAACIDAVSREEWTIVTIMMMNVLRRNEGAPERIRI